MSCSLACLVMVLFFDCDSDRVALRTTEATGVVNLTAEAGGLSLALTFEFDFHKIEVQFVSPQ